MLILGWHTGIKAEDLSMLSLEKILKDKERKCFWIHITGGKTENNERVMPVISDEAISVLRLRIKASTDGTLFHSIVPDTLYGQKYTRLQKAITPLRKNVLGNEVVDFHSLRRAFSVACEKAGTDPVQWSRMMGHALPTLASAIYNRGHKAEEMIFKLRVTNYVDKTGKLIDHKPHIFTLGTVPPTAIPNHTNLCNIRADILCFDAFGRKGLLLLPTAVQIVRARNYISEEATEADFGFPSDNNIENIIKQQKFV